MVERVDRIGEKEFRRVEQVGHEYTPEEILEKVKRDRLFMDHSGGGVTFSGGEPLMQPRFVLQTLTLLKREGFHTAVDTSGYVSRETLQSVMPVTDLFLYDIKQLHPELHRKFVGAENELIISNLDMLLEAGKEVMLRIPVIPGVSDSTAYMRELRDFIAVRNNGNIREINLLPYHKTGSSKYRRFDIEDRMQGVDQLTNKHLDEYIEILRPLGINLKRGG